MVDLNLQKYPVYKSSGIEWLGDIPEHWEVKKIKRITQIYKQGYYTENPYIDEGVKLARITDIDDFGNVSFENNIPILNGILTVENEQQAIDRAGKKMDKGSEFARASMEIINFNNKFDV